MLAKDLPDKAPIGALDPTALANKNVEGLLVGAYFVGWYRDPTQTTHPVRLGIFIDDRIFGSLTGGEAQRLERG
jgi:hypothetical protein